jgi:hypothetical protein
MVKKFEEWMKHAKTSLEHKHDTMVSWEEVDRKWNIDIII